MSTSKDKETTNDFNDLLKNQAKQHGLSLEELKKLYTGKACPKYGVKEILHVRKARGGKLTVFNISEKFRSEKISEGRKALKTKKDQKNISSESLEVKKS